MTYQQLIDWGKQRLTQGQIYDGFGFRLMLELCELHDINLYMDKDTEVNPKIETQYREGIERLCKHEPLAHILGFEWFFGRRFKVNSDVLIPREETEELIGHILADMDEYFDKDESLTVFDIGTGSGILAITLKAEEPSLEVYASDISEQALLVAKENSELLGTSITFLQGDMAQPFIDKGLKADLVVCNPPYIMTSEEVERSVVEYEPHLALFGGEDGLDFYRVLLDQAPLILKDKSMMAFEMGFNQRENLTKEIKKRFPMATIKFEKDLNGLDRMCFVYLHLHQMQPAVDKVPS